MKFRIVLAASLALGVALGTSGCNLIQPQATTKQYDASDGIGVNVGALKLRDLIVISNDGQLGSLILTGVNTTGHDITLSIGYGEGKISQQIVPSSDRRGKTWGGRNESQIILDGINAKPGAMLEVTFSDGTGNNTTLIPVLTTGQPEYNGLEPQPRLCSVATGCFFDDAVVN